jgi:hypothetical protein
LRHNVERQQKALDKATTARDEAQAALDAQADRLNAAKQRLEEAEQTRLTLLQALPTSGSPNTSGLSGTAAPSTPLAECPNTLPEVLHFLGNLLAPSDEDEATRLAKLGQLADSLRKGLSSRYSDPAAMAAALLRPPAAAPPPEAGDEAMHTADEAGTFSTGHRGVAVRLPDNKRRKGEPRESSGSDADEEDEAEAALRGEDAVRRRRSRTPPAGPRSGGSKARGPGSPATDSDS